MRKHLFKVILALIGFLSISSTFAQSQGIFQGSNPTVAVIGDERVKLDEVKRFFERNYSQEIATPEKLKEFLPDYALYKAKIQEAKNSGLEKDSAFINEVIAFEKTAAPSYWIENSIKKKLLDEFIERSQTEYLVSHVLIRLDDNASPEDTLVAFETLLEARKAFLDGATMDSLNQEFSTRVRGVPIGGDIPWFSVGITVHDFENAVYNMEPGEISMPVRSQFGYHLIYIRDKRERTAGRYTSHIFFRPGPDQQSGIEQALVELSNGMEWNEVVERYSEDRQSAPNGGSLGVVGYNLRYPEEFSNIVLNLDPTKEWIGPVQTQYGLHVFKVDSVEQLEITSERVNQLEQQLRLLPRYNLDENDVLERIQNLPQYQKYLKEADNNSDEASTRSLDQIIGDITAEYFPEYALTREQFTHGLMVFKLNDLYIWNPETVDSSKVRRYFDQNMDQYAQEIVDINSESETDSSSELSIEEPSKDELFQKLFIQIFSDMQPILEKEFHDYLFEKYEIKLFSGRIR